MTHRTLRQLVLAAFLVLLGSPAAAQIKLAGTVVDHDTGEPIVGVHVELYTETWYPVGERMTDMAGKFSIQLRRKGTYRLRVNRIGYEQVETPVFKVGRVTMVGIEVRMSPDAVPLAPLEIVAETRTDARFGDYDGFERRMRTGLGHFFTRADVERIRATRVSDLLVRVPGVYLESSGSGLHRTVRMARSGRLDGYCPVQLFVDGMHINRRTAAPGRGTSMSIDDVVSARSVQAVEVYKGLASIPAAFMTPDSRCGVVAIWTRRGRGNK